MHNFSQIDLKYTKLQQQKKRAHFSFGEKVYIKKGGGAKYEFQI